MTLAEDRGLDRPRHPFGVEDHRPDGRRVSRTAGGEQRGYPEPPGCVMARHARFGSRVCSSHTVRRQSASAPTRSRYRTPTTVRSTVTVVLPVPLAPVPLGLLLVSSIVIEEVLSAEISIPGFSNTPLSNSDA